MHAFATGGSSGSGSGGSGGGGSSASSSTTGGGGAGSPQLFCLRWNNYQSNLTNVFDQLLQSESFVDVTLACDGHSVKAHKVVLSACSPYFQALFFDNPCRHPIVILKDVRWPELKAAVEFMYKGEINVSQEQIGPLLQVAESLKIRGLADVSGAGDSDDSKADTVSLAPRPAKKRRRDSSPAADSPSASNGLPDALGLVTTSPPAPSSMCPPPPPPPQQQPPPANAASNQMSLAALPPPPPPPQSSASAAAADDMEIKPGIAEMIREEERAKMLESTHASWLGASTSSLADGCSTKSSYLMKLKAPTWTQAQLKEAIHAVVTQKMRFTQASTRYGIPKGTLYDNILGKTRRMVVLDEAGLSIAEETAVLDFCCEISLSPYNRRTKKSLDEVIDFVTKLKRAKDPHFMFTGMAGFRWWWAFCKKHSIVSLYYNNNNNNDESSLSPPSSPPARATNGKYRSSTELSRKKKSWMLVENVK